MKRSNWSNFLNNNKNLRSARRLRKLVKSSPIDVSRISNGIEALDVICSEMTEVSKKKPTGKIRVKKTTTGKSPLELYDKIWDDLVYKANKWARETAAWMRNSVPVDTGNLKESIHVLKKDCVIDKANGRIEMVVGSDLDPAGGRYKLYAPPKRKRSKKYGRKTPPWKGYRLMPSYPDEYASKFLPAAVIKKQFKTISKRTAKKIMGK